MGANLAAPQYAAGVEYRPTGLNPILVQFRGEGLPTPPQEPGMMTEFNLSYIVYIMSDRDFLGEFEHIVVLALLRLQDRAYGVTVRQEIEFRTDREVSIGAVYATLDRLERKGYVTSYRGDPTPERGGRSKRFFRVTTEGVEAVSRTHRALQSMTEGLGLIQSYA